jgi:uncharacterized glyoxalase superfamily metalloenzyme YdcJ
MYKTEVPLYGDLVRIVSQVNTGTLESNLDPGVLSMRHGDALGSSSRIDIERHGAIRLGTAQELRTIRRVFAIIGLEPVGYYDLTPAGLPMHATCFRPRTPESLGINPFRVFTSVLRPELIRDAAAKKLALHLLSKRDIFTPELMSLLEKADAQDGRLTISQGDGFIAAAMHTFKWHGTAASSYQDYMTLKAEHPVLADIACFRSAHINHLTPRTLDIVSAQEAMKRGGLRVKDRIEGPPRRKCPILLRQTSFLAIEEPIRFATTESTRSTVQASHRARFGEIEERGAAVTPRGRRLYDDLLEAAMGAVRRPVSAEALDAALADVFDKYPDSWDELRRLDLVYFSYRARGKSRLMKKRCSIDELLNEGAVEAVPITYEDFLPLSAAGIFQSNLGAQAAQALCAEQDVESMQAALGVALSHADDLYRCIRDQSVAECAALLGVEISGRV